MITREQLAKDNGMTIEFVNWFFDNKKDGCGNAWLVMMAAMWESWKYLSEQRDELAAESAALKSALERLYEAVSMPDSGPIPDKYYSSVTNAATVMYETPATDAFLREVQAQGVEMFALMFAEEAIKSNNITTGWRARASRAASEYAEALRQGGAA